MVVRDSNILCFAIDPSEDYPPLICLLAFPAGLPMALSDRPTSVDFAVSKFWAATSPGHILIDKLERTARDACERPIDQIGFVV